MSTLLKPSMFRNIYTRHLILHPRSTKTLTFPYPHMKKNWIHNPKKRVWMETEMRFVNSNENEEEKEEKEKKKGKKRIEDEMNKKFERVCENITMFSLFVQLYFMYKTRERDSRGGRFDGLGHIH